MSKNKTRTKDKYRVVYNDTQRIELENEFRVSEYISIPRKQEIAHKLKLSERQIKIWFQNRRAKKRKQDKRKLTDKVPIKSTVKLEKTHLTRPEHVTHISPPLHTPNLPVSTSSSTTMAPPYTDHQMLPSVGPVVLAATAAPASTSVSTPAASATTTDDYTYEYDYHNANSNIVHTNNSPNYSSDNNNAPQLDLASCHQPTTTPANEYNNYPPTLHNMHQPNHTTQTNNYYPTQTNHHLHHCTTNHLAHMNRANPTTIGHQHTNKPNNEDDFLPESRLSNGVSQTTEACYNTTRPFGSDIYETRNQLSQYVDGGGGCAGPQCKLRTNSYNNLGSINNHHQPATQLYAQQPQPTGDHMFVARQQFYY